VAGIEFSVRHMLEDDLPGVADVEAGVFTDWYRVYRKDPEPLPERTIEELRYASSRDPEGNFVAIARDGALVGFMFSRTWGRVGWMGTFGVPTQLQGLGIGKALFLRTLEHLRKKTTIIGLETMPESGANLGLYIKSGFVLTYPTVVLELSLIKEADRLKDVDTDGVATWGAQDRRTRRRLIRQIQEISAAHLPGLDYSIEVEGIHEHEFGETLFSTDEEGRIEGFAVLRTAPFRGEDTSGRAYLHVLAVGPGADADHAVTRLLGGIWSRATRLGLTKVVTGVNSRHPHALELLLGSGFIAIRAAIRMVEKHAPPELFTPSNGVNVARWAG